MQVFGQALPYLSYDTFSNKKRDCILQSQVLYVLKEIEKLFIDEFPLYYIDILSEKLKNDLDPKYQSPTAETLTIF